MIIVTGGAGFIGSNIVAALSARGDEVVVCDWLGSDDKWRNIAKHRVFDFVLPEQLNEWISRNQQKVEAVIHMGAISATTERDADLILRTNFQLSLDLWRQCADHGWPFIYASSAATYGDGEDGFVDLASCQYLSRLRPLNPYGWSKHLFDQRACGASERCEPTPPKWAGLKFFNVFGPNEYHKGNMRSVVSRSYKTIMDGNPMLLFKSYRSDYEHGGQRRDFIYVSDCVSVVLWMIDNEFPSSIYNVGSGNARTWLDLARACFSAAGIPERIEFIDMPGEIRERYQYFTMATMEKLRSAGYHNKFLSLEDSIMLFWQKHLNAADPFL